MVSRRPILIFVGVIALAACAKSEKQTTQMPTSRPQSIVIAVDKDGAITWDGEPVSKEELFKRMQQIGKKQ